MEKKGRGSGMKQFNCCLLWSCIISVCFIFGISASLYIIYVESNHQFLILEEKRLKDEKYFQGLCVNGDFAKEYDHITHECASISIRRKENTWMVAMSMVLATKGFCATESCIRLITDNFNLMLSINNIAIVLSCIMCFLTFRMYINSTQQPFIYGATNPQQQYTLSSYLDTNMATKLYKKQNNRIEDIHNNVYALEDGHQD